MKTDSTKGLNISQVLIVGTAAALTTITPQLNNSFYRSTSKNNLKNVYSYKEYYPSADNIISILKNKNTDESESVIQLPTIKKLSIKIKKITPLKFVGNEDSKGFI